MDLLFATGNDDKFSECQDALAETDITLKQASVDIDEIDAADVEDVARRKARDSFDALETDSPVMVDDTGLYIDALNGFPGSHASFVLDSIGVDGILTLMEDRQNRDAYFKTTIAIYYPETDTVWTGSGICEGAITREKRGNKGFGYDPVFLPDNHEKTFAEDTLYKMDVSHRTQATRELLKHLKDS